MEPYTQLPPFFAQWGEDRWLAETYVIPPDGVFVDVGAGDGERGSNTLYFENLGWRGLAIDADPRNAEALRRRRCAVETCAVSNTAGPRLFGSYARKPSWSGLERRGPDYELITVDCRRLEDLLAPLAFTEIDLLSIDVEGTELDVWDSIDHSVRACRILIIEFDDDHHPGRSRSTIHRRIGLDKFDLVHESPANLIYERRDHRWPRRPTRQQPISSSPS